MKTNPDDHAFPMSDLSEFGLTKREYFAAMAVSGGASRDYWTAKDVAEYAVECADALIEKLNMIHP